MRKFEPSASKLPPPVVESRTHSDAPSSAPTESFFTPQTENPEHSLGIDSSLGSEPVAAVTEEPESMTEAEVPSPAEPEPQVESAAEKKVEETPEAAELSPPAPVEEEVKVNPQDLEIEKYRGELQAVSAQIEDALKELHRYKAELATSTEEKDSLRNEVQEHKAERVTSGEEKDALRKDIQMYKDELTAASLAKEGLREELEKSKVALSTSSEEKAGLREDVAVARAELEEASRARSRLNSQIQNLKEELRNTLNVVDDKTSLIDRLLSEVGNLKDNIRMVLLQKEEVARLAEKEREYMEERFNAEKEEFIHAATEDREEARREVARLKGLVAVERHSHKERHRDVSQEKDDLLAKLESEQSRITSLLLQVDSHQDRINGLEVHLEDSREETRELYNKHNEREAKIHQMEEELLEERDRITMKDSQIHFLETTKESMEIALVQLQTKTNETNRQNDMFQEQIRQQADQLQHRAAHPNQTTSTYGYGYSDAFGAGIGRFMASTATLSAFSTFTRGLRRGATNTRAEAGVKALKLLNDEIYQLAASLTDQLESVNKRFVPDDSALPASSTVSTSLAREADGVRRAKAEYLKSTLGLELINKLERDASQEMEDTNPFFLQVALQGSLTACCTRIITSWYPSEWEYGSFLETLYERIRGTGELCSSSCL
ncbi:hypothetical protein CPB83DRAFT_860300 [Crepidotus variabilis]|uniref:Uncharacterized protein n=1 Tax=Crepidotus variabilis TaxID=179855 RepID=A0A9P6E9H5_9AGAR|nr:hypothetical protein CPB83DRAFT_860300 [Crepidotus variabilis]